MHLSIRPPARLVLGSSMAAILSGCGFQGPSPAPAPGPSLPQTAQVAKGDAGKGQTSEPGRRPKVSLRNRVDPKCLSNVVKEEVKGGEATDGPTPSIISGCLESRADQGRAAHGQRPRRTSATDSQDRCAGLQPDHEGKVRAGPSALFRSAGLARRHGELRDLPQPRQGLDRRMPVSIGIDGQTGQPERTDGDQHRSTARRCSGTAEPRRSRARRRGRSRTRSRWASRRTSRSSSGCEDPGVHASSSRRSSAPNVTLDGMAKAIATFERVAALSGNSPYDKYNAGDNKALSDSEKRGMVLFGLRLNTDDEFKTDVVLQKAKCTLCHVRASTSPTSSSTTSASAGTRRPGSSPTWAAGRSIADRRQERRRPRRIQDADGSRRRPDRPVHARRQPEDARSSRRALRQGGQPQPVARHGHEAAQADRPGRRPTWSPS